MWVYLRVSVTAVEWERELGSSGVCLEDRGKWMIRIGCGGCCVAVGTDVAAWLAFASKVVWMLFDDLPFQKHISSILSG